MKRMTAMGALLTILLALPAGAVTLTGNPLADGWQLQGNSQGAINAGGSTVNNYDVYTTAFTLDLSGDSVTTSDLGNTHASLGLGSFQDGDQIIGVGVKWNEGQESGYNFFLKLDPDQNSFAPGQTSFSSYSTDGDIQISGVDYTTNRVFDNYRVNNGGNTGYYPYGQNFLNTDGGNPDAGPFHTNLPARGFGLAGANGWTSYEFLVNISAIQRSTEIDGGPFGSHYNFYFGTGSHTDATYTDVVVTGAAVPEPATLALLALGGLCFRRKQA